jgi:xylulokinase
MPAPVYLGLDCSTQSLTAMMIEPASGRIVFEHAIEFDRDLPEFGTSHGVHRRGGTVTSPPLMWAAALDRMMAVLGAQQQFDIARLAAIAGSAQQHGTVYLNAAAEPTWRALDPRGPLADQISTIFSRNESPVWMDESTGPQCVAMTAALGGAEAVASRTGSRIYERFSGPQIRKFAEHDPLGYLATDRIHLVSSFIASLLSGCHAAIDPGDGAGMNLMDIRRLEWSDIALEATAPELRRRLPPIQPSGAIVSTLSPYWQRRYGLPAARVALWSGDNPCSLVGTGIVGPEDIAVSLGTSDTVFGWTLEPRPSSGGHVFGSPSGGYMTLVCFRNGSLARERVRDAHRLDWTGFSNALRATAPGNGGAVMLPWFEAEITPRVPVPGVRRINFQKDDAAADVRAVVEAQMMAMANHWAALSGAAAGVRRIRATGGASENREILQVMADVFGADVYAAGGNAACLGASLRAWHADAAASGKPESWGNVVSCFTSPDAARCVASRPPHASTYAALRRQYAEFEATAQDLPARSPYSQS